MAIQKKEKAIDTIPGDIHIERSVLSAFLYREQALNKIHELKPDDFFFDESREIFEIITTVYREGLRPDSSIVYQKWKEKNTGKKVPDAIIELAKINVPVNWQEHIHKIIDLANRRRLMVAAEKVINDSKNELIPISETVTEYEREIIEASTGRGVRYCNLEDISGTPDKLFEVKEHLKYGVKELDDILFGAFGGQLIIIGARPGIGKTALALQIAKNMSKDNGTLFFSLEMPKLQLVRRMITAETGISANRMRSGHISADEKERIRSTLKMLGVVHKHLTIVDSTSEFSEIVNVILRYHAEHNLRAVFIDYLQLARANLDLERYLQLGHMTRTLKELAIKLDIPTIAISQLTRNSAGREPDLEDLRESGNIEQDADVVIFPHRKKADEEKTKMIIAKHRDGEIGFRKMRYEPKLVTFFSDDEPEPVPEAKYGRTPYADD
jgi:replicative DNA helicase